MKQQPTHWSVILDIVDAGLDRDPEKLRNYADLLATRLEEAGDTAMANRLRRRLQRRRVESDGLSSTLKGGPILSPQAAFAPVDPESRSTFTDEIFVSEDEPLILTPYARSEIDRLITLRQHTDDFLRAGIPMPRAVLLYGPPGCGKSSTARYLAFHLKLPLLTLRLDAVMSSFLGTTAKNLRSVFEYAARRGAILFLDEFDAVAKMRDDSNEVGEIKRIVNSLIQNLDAFPRLFVVAATNHEHLLDPAIWRRFDASIQLPLPGEEERQQLFLEFLPPGPWERDEVESLAMLTDDFSGADIARVVTRSRQEAILRYDVPLLQLLVIEVWRQVQGHMATPTLHAQDADDKLPLLQFIDARTRSQLSTRSLAALAGVSHTTVARMRRIEGELSTHG